ncbi:hypothetical protein DL240_14340 [Lujinxingia litoralis]|uniref:Outer membrane protein beta-barrel domain-containing protein n=1 Tax=Lujinxingia litoralis TaxID=2211119 RepID=A0A328C665_9DELT|nr:outer membrane beta-barrel protein [Lujinxingia litoralis]RAL20861.1 hypothetical protein DL240_14340 [Lujinxingia litoralis]
MSMMNVGTKMGVAALAALGVLGMASTALAQEASSALVGNSAGVVVGYDLDAEVPLAGLDARFTFAVAPQVALSVNPGLQYYFIGSNEVLGARTESTVLQFDLNALVHLALDAPVTPYLGLGAGLRYADVRIVNGDGDVLTSDDATDLGANLLVGLSMETGSNFVPYVQGRVTVFEETSFALMAGLNFEF